MIHPGLAALEKWDTIEYAAGYRARLAAIPDSEIAHHCWRCGWEDADTEALELDRRFCKFTTFCNLLRRCDISTSFLAYPSIRWKSGASLRKRTGTSPKAHLC